MKRIPSLEDPVELTEPPHGGAAAESPTRPADARGLARVGRYAGWSVRSFGALIPLIALWIVLAIASPVFFTTDNLTNLLLQASTVGILAFGSTLVLITEEIDLSIGAIAGLAGVVAGVLIVNHDVVWPLAVVLVLVLTTFVGFLNGVITVYVRVPSFITTLAMLGLVTGVAQTLSNGTTISGFPSGFQFIGSTEVFGIKLPVLIAIGVMLVLWALLRHTRFGLNLYAVGDNRSAANLAGVRPSRVKILALCISGACAGIAGLLVSARLDAAASSFGASDLLNAIAAVVIGGTALTGGVGSVIGTAFGVLIIVTIQNGLTLLDVSPLWTPSFVGGVILLATVIHRFADQRDS